MYGLMFSYFLLSLRRFKAVFNINSLILTGGKELLGEFQSVQGLHNFREFFQPQLPTSILMRLKSVIAFLKYFSGIIINTDGVFSQPCYPHLNTLIDQ